MEKLLKPRDVAELLNIGVPTVQRMAKDGRLPSIKIGGRLRFDLEEVKKAIAAAQENQK